jgi:hypothetical protein
MRAAHFTNNFLFGVTQPANPNEWCMKNINLEKKIRKEPFFELFVTNY